MYGIGMELEVGELLRDLPLQLFAHLHQGSITVVCAKLDGEEVITVGGLDPDSVGSTLAHLIRSSVPAPPGAQWKMVLPNGTCLDGDAQTLPLQNLFDFDEDEVMRRIDVQFGPRILQAAHGGSM